MLIKYLHKGCHLSSQLISFKLKYVPLEGRRVHYDCQQETPVSPNIEVEEVYFIDLDVAHTALSSIRRPPPDEGGDMNINRKVVKYTLLLGKIYKMEKATPMLRCLDESDTALVLTKVHKGACNSHIGGKSLVHKLLRSLYNWPRLMKTSSPLSRNATNAKDILTFTTPQQNFSNWWSRPDHFNSGAWISYVIPPCIGPAIILDSIGGLLQ